MKGKCGRGENNIKTSDLIAAVSTIYISKGWLNLPYVSGQEAAEVSFNFDITRLNNDFERLWFQLLTCHRSTPYSALR